MTDSVLQELRRRTHQNWASTTEYFDYHNRGIVPDWMKTPAPARVAALPMAPAPRPAPTAAPAPVLASFVTSVSRLARMLFPAPAGMNWMSAVALIKKDHDFLVASGDQEDRMEIQGFPPENQKTGFWMWVFNAGEEASVLIEMTTDGDVVSIRSKNLLTGEEKTNAGSDSDSKMRGVVIGAMTVLGARENLNAAKAASAPPAPTEAPSVP